MKYLIVIILSLFHTGFFSITHTDDLEKALRALKQKDFNAAKQLIDQAIGRNSFDPGAYYALSIYYSDPDNRPYDYFKAYDYLILAEKYYSTLTTREANQLQKLGITPTEIQRQKQQVGLHAVQQAIQAKDLAAADRVIARFATLPDVVQKATEFKHEAAFEEANRTNTYQAFQNFFVKYPQAKQAEEAREKYEQLLFKNLTADNSWQAYENFYKNYPKSPYRDRAIKLYEKLYFEQQIKASPTPDILGKYIRENPSGAYTAEAKAMLESLESLLPVRIGEMWGFVNGSGKTVIQPAYERAGAFSQGLARVRRNGKWGYIDTKGKLVVPAVYDMARDFNNGAATVMRRGRKGLEAFYIDLTGNTLFGKTYPTDGSYWPIHSFKDGLAAVEDVGSKKLGFIDTKGNYAVAPIFNFTDSRRNAAGVYPFSAFEQGYAWVRSDDGTGLIDTKGVFLLKGSYAQPALDSTVLSPYYYSFSDGLCLIEESSGTLYINQSGRKSITIPVGFTATPFADSVAWTRSKYDNKYYLIDTQGRTILSMAAHKAYPFREGRAVIQKEPPAKRVYFYDQTPEPTYSYVDKEGRSVYDFKFDILAESPFNNGAFKNGIACILMDGKQTYINKEGKIVWQSTENWNEY